MRRIRRQELPPTPVFFHAAQRSIRVNVEAAVIAPLSRHLDLTLGYVVRFDNPAGAGRQEDRPVSHVRGAADVRGTRDWTTGGL